MPLLVPNVSERELLAMLVNRIENANTKVRLFKNNYTPAPDSTLANFVEADYSGYLASANLANGDIDPNPDANGRAVATWPLVAYAHNGGGVNNTVYGYYVVAGDNKLLWAERFADPVQMQPGANAIAFRPRFTLDSEFNG